MGLLERYKGTSSPPFHRPVGCCGSQDTTGRQAIWNPAGFASLSLFPTLLAAILQGSVKENAFFGGRFCGVRNASLRRPFCCVVHQKRDFKAHPAASTTLLVGSFQLAADSRLSTHSASTLDLGSLFSTLETRDPATACVDSEASSSTVALGKALSMVATKRFIGCDPHASSFLILRSAPVSELDPSLEPGPPLAFVPTSESD